MAYTVYKADGATVVVPDNAVSNQFYNANANGIGKGIGIQLVGRNTIDYGPAVAQTFLQLASNFAGSSMPTDATALQGQLWFDTANETLYVRTNNSTTGGILNWKQIGASLPTIGQPIHDMYGALLAYTTNSIPATDSVSNYVSLDLDNYSGTIGWLRLTPAYGMTLQITAPDSTTLGYAFPV